jgi:RES domain-containing protein
VIAYRIADARHPIFDPTGAMLHGGRWNSIGKRVIYAAESFAGAMLEVLAHANLSVPPRNHRVVRIEIPGSVEVETLLPSALSAWDTEDFTVPRDFGDRWLTERRTAVLRVPSVITEGRENNVLVNPLQPQFSEIVVGKPEAIRWDARLFAATSRR